MADNDFIMLKRVRVSFPHLFRNPVINGQEGKKGAALMLHNDTDAKMIGVINAEIAALAKAKLKGRKLPDDKVCLRPGEDKGRPEYDGYHILSANSKGSPAVVARDGKSVVASDAECAIYAGCFVNAKVRLWAQNNQFGQRVNCELIAIQFADDGDPLDGSYVSEDQAVEGFDVTDGDDDFLAA